MGCEFSNKVNEYQRDLVRSLYDLLTDDHKKQFITIYGPIEKMSEFYKAYYHCKRALVKYPYITGR